jgi:hypothetical protein
MVSPNTLGGAPGPEDVRDGVVYALESLVGTLKVPLPTQVSIGVPTDDTVGTAILNADDVKDAIWNVPTSELNVEYSIGKRLKNVATVESTGEQITALMT